jgi:hypothetical protein
LTLAVSREEVGEGDGIINRSVVFVCHFAECGWDKKEEARQRDYDALFIVEGVYETSFVAAPLPAK